MSWELRVYILSKPELNVICETKEYGQFYLFWVIPIHSPFNVILRWKFNLQMYAAFPEAVSFRSTRRPEIAQGITDVTRGPS